MPPSPASTAAATTASQSAPASIVITVSSISMPAVVTCTTVPRKPASAITRFDPPATTRVGIPRRSSSLITVTSVSVSEQVSRSSAGPPRCRVVSSASGVSARWWARVRPASSGTTEVFTAVHGNLPAMARSMDYTSRFSLPAARVFAAWADRDYWEDLMTRMRELTPASTVEDFRVDDGGVDLRLTQVIERHTLPAVAQTVMHSDLVITRVAHYGP